MTEKENKIAIEKREKEKEEPALPCDDGRLTVASSDEGGLLTASENEATPQTAAACISHPMWEQWASIDKEFTKRRLATVNCCAIATSCPNWEYQRCQKNL